MKILAGFVLFASAIGRLTAGSPDDQSIHAVDDWHNPYLLVHEQQVNDFLGSARLGILRTIPQAVPGMHGSMAPSHRVNLPDKQRAAVIYWDLVGIAVSPQPRVYCVKQAELKPSSDVISKGDSAVRWKRAEGDTTVAHRKLDPFEAASLKQLQSGHAYCDQREGNVVRGMGAIRAMASPVSDATTIPKEGDLLGAFTYYYFVRKREPDKAQDAFESVYKKGKSDRVHWDTYRDKVGYAKPPADKPYPDDTYVFMVDLLWQNSGKVRDTLIAHVRDERASLEQWHLAPNPKQPAYGWESVETKSVKKPQTSLPK